jgi:hypothetical protein
MIDAPPSWYLDPTSRHELRYWDGTQWTEHVASAGVGAIDPVGQPGSTPNASGAASRARRFFGRHLGWVGLLVCVLAVSAGTVTVFGLDRATAGQEVRLDGSTQDVRLPPHQKYGVYIEDADNSGYTEDCSAADASRRPVRLADPSWSVSDSDTEDLDYVFDTGSGALTFDCSIPGERVTLRPVPNPWPLLAGIVLSGLLSCLGAGLILTWFVPWVQRRAAIRRSRGAAVGPTG